MVKIVCKQIDYNNMVLLVVGSVWSVAWQSEFDLGLAFGPHPQELHDDRDDWSVSHHAIAWYQASRRRKQYTFVILKKLNY